VEYGLDTITTLSAVAPPQTSRTHPRTLSGPRAPDDGIRWFATDDMPPVNVAVRAALVAAIRSHRR